MLTSLIFTSTASNFVWLPVTDTDTVSANARAPIKFCTFLTTGGGADKYFQIIAWAKKASNAKKKCVWCLGQTGLSFCN